MAQPTTLEWSAIKARASETCPLPAIVLAKINVAARKCGAIGQDGRIDARLLLGLLIQQRHTTGGKPVAAGAIAPAGERTIPADCFTAAWLRTQGLAEVVDARFLHTRLTQKALV